MSDEASNVKRETPKEEPIIGVVGTKSTRRNEEDETSIKGEKDTVATKKRRTSIEKKPVVFTFWPSTLIRAGHTTVTVTDPNDPLYKYLTTEVPPDQRYGIHMKRMADNVPCFLIQSSKYRHGANRWWCPVHQGSYGKKAQVQAYEADVARYEKDGGAPPQRRCDCAHEPIDLVQNADIPVFTLVDPDHANDPKEQKDDNHLSNPNSGEYCELGIWIGLPPALDTTAKPGEAAAHYFPGIHVHARRVLGGKKVVDTNFPAVIVRDLTGRFSKIGSNGVVITSPAALEYLMYMENQCPINREKKKKEQDNANDNVHAALKARKNVELVANVTCKHCGSFHEDIGKTYGVKDHGKHLCGQCGRDIWSKPWNIGNPLQAFKRDWSRRVVGSSGDTEDAKKAVLRLEKDKHALMMWPSTPAVFWSRDAPEVWGIHVHAYNRETGQCVIDDSFGKVILDGKELNRDTLFCKMIDALVWMQNNPSLEEIAAAQELEDD